MYAFRFVFLMVSYLVASSVLAYAAPPLERIISVDIRNEPISEALVKIGREGNFAFAYNPAIFVNKSSVTYEGSGTVREVLNQLFKGKITYRSKGNHVILHRAELLDETPKNFVLEGYIIDSRTGRKIDQVSIYEKTTLVSTITNTYGYYRIKLPTDLSSVRLEVRRKYYVNEAVTVSARKSHTLNIPLTPVSIQGSLQPIVIVRSSVDTIRPTLASPQPIVTAVPVAVDTTLSTQNILKAALERGKTEFVNWLTTTRQTIHDANMAGDTLYRGFQVSVLPFIGSNHALSGRVINQYSFNLVAGYSMGIQELEIGGGLNLVRGEVSGIQLAGLGNVVGGNVRAIQAGGFFNAVRKDFWGLQLAGVGNTVLGTSQGLQIGGFYNLALGRVDRSVQAAGFINIAGRDMQGVQVASFFNFAGRELRGLQVAGYGNVVAGNITGIQLSGFFNVTANQLSGWQLSPCFNYAGEVVRGHQFSILNIAQRSETAPFGLFSYVQENGYRRLELSTDEVHSANLTFKTGVRSFYNIFTAGSSFRQLDRPAWSVGYGFGTAIRLGRRWGLNVDLTGNWYLPDRWQEFEEAGMLIRLQSSLEKKLGNRLALAIGPSVNGFISDYFNRPSTRIDVPLFKQQTDLGISFVSGWVGFQAAVRFCNPYW